MLRRRVPAALMLALFAILFLKLLTRLFALTEVHGSLTATTILAQVALLLLSRVILNIVFVASPILLLELLLLDFLEVRAHLINFNFILVAVLGRRPARFDQLVLLLSLQVLSTHHFTIPFLQGLAFYLFDDLSFFYRLLVLVEHVRVHRHLGLFVTLISCSIVGRKQAQPVRHVVVMVLQHADGTIRLSRLSQCKI